MEARGRINCYICTTCKKGTYTINLSAGTTPFVTQCQHCGFATAESRVYRLDRPTSLAVTKCWYRPTKQEFDLQILGGSLQQHVRMGGLLYGDIAKAVPLPNDETGERWDELRLDIYMKRIYGDNGVPVAPLTPMESTELLGKVSEEMAEEIRETEKAAVTKSMRSSPTVIAAPTPRAQFANSIEEQDTGIRADINEAKKLIDAMPAGMWTHDRHRNEFGWWSALLNWSPVQAGHVARPVLKTVEVNQEKGGDLIEFWMRAFRLLPRIAEHCERLRLNFWRLQSEIAQLTKVPPVPGMDGKYGVITSSRKAFHMGEPIFLLRATDPLAPRAVLYYHLLCQREQCAARHIDDVGKHLKRIEEWQSTNANLVKRKPD